MACAAGGSRIRPASGPAAAARRPSRAPVSSTSTSTASWSEPPRRRSGSSPLHTSWSSAERVPGPILPPMLGRLKRQRRTRRQILIDRASRPTALLGDLDQAVLRFLRTRGHDPATEAVMKGLGLSGEYGAIWMGIGSAAAAADERRRMRWLFAAGVAPAAIVLNFAVKRTIGRQRPVITDHPPLARAPSKLSFPSAHATSSFAAAAALGRVEPRAKAPLHGLATA